LTLLEGTPFLAFLLMDDLSLSRMSRRRCLGLLAGSASLLSMPGLAGATTRRPNVVFILTDDQGTVDMNCYGSTDLITPHMDALADQGVRFTDFYVTAPMCTASRISLLTGRHFQRSYFAGKGIHESETTIAELFRGAGYRTAVFGKWHLGGPPWDPLGQGFDEFVGHRVGAIDNYSHFSYWGGSPRHALYREREPYREDGTYFPELVTRESIDFATRDDARPFFLFVSHNQPHYPLQPEVEYLEQYGHVQGDRRRYGAAVTSLDAQIGRLLQALDEGGLRENTIVVLMSDNGHSEEASVDGRGGSAGPFRGAKKTLFEGGLRVPSIVSWPGTLPSGQVRTQMATALDWLPTLADWCGIDTGDLALDGRSLDRVVRRNEPTPHEALHWQLGPMWAIREGDWKLMHAGGGAFLANLAQDPGERVNVAARHPDVVRRLTARHDAWRATGIEPIYTVESP
jgi:arylsulfatase A